MLFRSAADLIVLGPGSLFTSIIPNLLVPGVAEAVRSTAATVLFVCSLADMQGETWGLSVGQHLAALRDHGLGERLDHLLVHDPSHAAAVIMYTQNTPLHLSAAEEKLAEEVREQHAVTSPLEGIIRDFVELEIPTGWGDMDIKTRKLYLASSDKVSVLGGETKYIKREYISAAEIWVECLDGDLKKYTNKDARLINSILKEMSKSKITKRLKSYGKQRVWVLK